MTPIAVITGDLINSTRVSNPGAFRHRLRELMQMFGDRYQAIGSLYRGDGFQFALQSQRFNAIEVALVLRTGLIASSTVGDNRWDARVAIAYGSGDLSSDQQNSPAFINSGRALDTMKKSHLHIVGEDELSSLALNAATAFADNIINSLTAVEAEVSYYRFLYGESHQNIATRLGKKRPTVTEALQRARFTLLDQYAHDAHRFIEIYHGP